MAHLLIALDIDVDGIVGERTPEEALRIARDVVGGSASFRGEDGTIVFRAANVAEAVWEQNVVDALRAEDDLVAKIAEDLSEVEVGALALLAMANPDPVKIVPGDKIDIINMTIGDVVAIDLSAHDIVVIHPLDENDELSGVASLTNRGFGVASFLSDQQIIRDGEAARDAFLEATSGIRGLVTEEVGAALSESLMHPDIIVEPDEPIVLPYAPGTGPG